MDSNDKIKVLQALKTILEDCTTDQQYHQRLIFAKQRIENSLADFTEDEIEVEDDYYGEYYGF